ncbi:MAG: three-Cys-motif partner protein TcmP [Fimbriimonadaceae bacterium]|nr:three-Cys-motif partner protein TcmP [Fimbriimonadaceae bacterium]
MDPATFFDEVNARTLVKAKLVADYFAVWSAALLASRAVKSLAYVEFSAGPGRFEDGTESTPLLVLRHALEWPPLAERLVTVFNDINPAYVASLRQAVTKLPGIERLRFPPVFASEALDMALVDKLSELIGMPILVFADPWTYTSLTGKLLERLLRGWSAELLFMFNYNRINMALGDPTHEAGLAELFGSGQLQRLRARLDDLDSGERETAVLRGLAERLGRLGAPFVLPFRFCHLDGSRTSFYVIYASRNSLGQALMRGVMADSSTSDTAYEYERADKAWCPAQPLASCTGTLVPVFLDELALGAKLETVGP